MPKSEIDDIFASKGKIAAQPSAGSAAASSSKSKKRKRKAETDENPSSQPSAKKVPETIIDPSASMPSAKRVKATKASEKAAEPKGKAKRESKNVKEQEDRFKDSRGSGPRTCIPAHYGTRAYPKRRSQDRGRLVNIQS